MFDILHTFLSVFSALVFAAPQETAVLATPAAPVRVAQAAPAVRSASPSLSREDVQALIETEVEARIRAYDTRIKNNTDFDPENSMLQPYYVPVMANEDLGTVFTISNLNAGVGTFSEGVSVPGDDGAQYCLTVESGVVVASAGGC